MIGLSRSCCVVTASLVSGNFLKILAAIFVCPRPSEYSMLTTGTPTCCFHLLHVYISTCLETFECTPYCLTLTIALIYLQSHAPCPSHPLQPGHQPRVRRGTGTRARTATRWTRTSSASTHTSPSARAYPYPSAWTYTASPQGTNTAASPGTHSPTATCAREALGPLQRVLRRKKDARANSCYQTVWLVRGRAAVPAW